MPEIDFRKLPFIEAIDFFKKKLAMGESEFNRLSIAARLRAFTISDMADKAMMKDVQESILSALKQGTTYRDFQKEFQGILENRGWTGPTPWRLNTILQTNIQTAYEVGRYKQLTDKDVIKARPYWQYVAVMDSRTRPTHASLNGKVFPADDPFWDKWYPPNGFNCRCTVRSLSQHEIEREEMSIEKKDPTGSIIRAKDPETGIATRVALFPDEGWDYNPGKMAA